jgi:hypothetical protein
LFSCCHAGGNVIDFAVIMDGGDKDNQDDGRAAALKLQDWFGLEFERPKGGKRRPPQPQLMPDAGVSTTDSNELAKEKEVPEPQAEAEHATEVILLNPVLVLLAAILWLM